jgi:hypothetical protein
VNETSLTYIQILPEIKKEVKPQVYEFAGRRSNRSSYLTAVGQFSSKAKSFQVTLCSYRTLPIQLAEAAGCPPVYYT